MKTLETEKPAILESITVRVITKWLDLSDKRNPQIKFKLSVSCEGREMQCDYSGGILAFQNRKRPAMVSDGQGKMLQASIVVTRPVRTLYDERNHTLATEALFTAAKIDPLGVLSSLVMDMDAGAISFDEFCSGFGYDEDSRKAFATWQICQTQGAEFRKVAGKHLDAIREAVQDY